MVRRALACLALLPLSGAVAVQHEDRKPRKINAREARSEANLTLRMDSDSAMSSCQYIEVPAGTSGHVQLPHHTGIRSLSMWIAPYKDLGYSWEYMLDARSGLGSGWFAFLNSMSSIHKGSMWSDTVYVNGVASNTAGLVTAASGASYQSAPWIHVYIEADRVFSDDITLLARYTRNEILPGKIYCVHLWPTPLSADDIQHVITE
jgi:hypothetical protein